MKATLEWLENPEVFCVNREAAHSDHDTYKNYDEYKKLQEKKVFPKGSYVQSLNGMWKFHFCENPSKRPEDFYKENYNVDTWVDIEVPSHIQLNYEKTPNGADKIGKKYDQIQYINTMYPWDGKEFLRPPHISKEYNPVGSYVTEFDVDARLMEQDKIYVSFQGFETAIFVWLNGEFVGYAEDGFTPTNFNLTELIREKKNRLCVEVYKRSSASWIEDQDFFRFSGLFRDVYLFAEPKVHVKDIFAKAGYDYENKNGKLDLDLDITGEYSKVVVRVTDVKANEVFVKEIVNENQKNKDCEAENNKTKNNEIGIDAKIVDNCSNSQIKISETIQNILPWSAEVPNLYNLFVEAYSKQNTENENTESENPEQNNVDTLVELAHTKIGFRTFEMKNGIMCLNGKRIIFKGVNRHEFSCERGRAITMADMLWDIKFMKRYNINAVRTCHYPNNSLWYRLCDEYGIYLIDEANLESHGSWQKMGAVEPSWNVPGSLPEWVDAVVDRAKSMLERDKNHPSVLIWSCGNESYAGDDIAAMSAFFHERDCTRLVHYEGVFHNREYDYISDMESRMYAKPQEIEEYLKQNTGKPYISCEYMHAMGNSLGGMKLYTDLEAKYEGYQGGFIWDYIDQSLYRTRVDGTRVLAYGGDFDERPTDYGFCTNGIVYANRVVSPKAVEAKQLYSNVKLSIKNGICTVKNENLFADTSAYKFRVRKLVNGIETKVYETDCIVAAGETDSFELEFENDANNNTTGNKSSCVSEKQLHDAVNEIVYEVSMVQKQETLYAKAGHEICFAQEVVAPSKKQDANTDKTSFNNVQNTYDYLVTPLEKDSSNTKVIYGDVCIGVKGENFYAQINKAEGGLSSLVVNGKELITRTPTVSFWRAKTDNDDGNRVPYVVKDMQTMMAAMNRMQGDATSQTPQPDVATMLNMAVNTGMGQWYTASKCAQCNPFATRVEEKDYSLVASFQYITAAMPRVIYNVTYEIFFDGKVKVTVDYPGYLGDFGPAEMFGTPEVGTAPGPMADLPVFAIDFKVKNQFSHVSYYGMGPEENYLDRDNGVRLGRFETTPQDSFSAYLKPQECGNHRGVRQAFVSDGRGCGLHFTAINRPFEMSVLPYSCYELDNAAHREELSESEYIYIRIASDQMGVGGDDSWGAPVQSIYRLNGNEPRRIEFFLN